MASPGGQGGAGALSTRGGSGVRRMKWALELSLGNTRYAGCHQATCSFTPRHVTVGVEPATFQC